MDVVDTSGRDGAAGDQAARVVVGCVDVQVASDVLCEQLGFRLASLWPADDPTHAVVGRAGLTVEFRRDDLASAGGLGLSPVTLVLPERAPDDFVAPPGLLIEFAPEVAAASFGDLPVEPTVSVDDGPGVAGRAGMRYRDLIPGRLGGRYIASLIEIPDGGEVPDYVHFHDVRFQMIYCAAGWVRVVYEDQGEPFTLEAGDCVLQPPGLRHRVLEASPGVQVIEVSAPAEHVTHREHELTLPNGTGPASRRYGGQRFVHHVAAGAERQPWRGGPLRSRDTGIAEATDGMARVRVVAGGDVGGADAPEPGWTNDDAELLLIVVLGGTATLEVAAAGDDDVLLRAGTAVTVPRDTAFRLVDATSDFEALEVAIDA